MNSRTAYLILILGIWAAALVACALKASGDPIGSATLLTIIIGIVYCNRH